MGAAVQFRLLDLQDHGSEGTVRLSVPAAAAPALHGIPAGAALDMGITNKAFDSYEQSLIRDVIAARIPAKLDAAKLFG